MIPILRTLAAVAALSVAAAPAYAQNINAGANGTFGRVALQTGFLPDPHDMMVNAGGPVQASSVDAACAGRVAARPSVSLRFTAGQLPLIISATSEADTTLVVRAPDRSWHCNDDAVGLNPVVRFDAPTTGRYQIWVGTFGEATDAPEAVLHISEVVAGDAATDSAPNPALDPAYGAVDLASGFAPDPHTIDISAGGSFAAAALGSQGCVGWIATAPDYRVNWTAGSGGLPLVFSVQADADTTLVINDAAGNWVCDDDGGNNGLNPAITFANPASGQYDVWVGTFAQGELQKSTLNVSELYAQ
jgi:hypothetical protein